MLVFRFPFMLLMLVSQIAFSQQTRPNWIYTHDNPYQLSEPTLSLSDDRVQIRFFLSVMPGLDAQLPSASIIDVHLSGLTGIDHYLLRDARVDITQQHPDHITVDIYTARSHDNTVSFLLFVKTPHGLVKQQLRLYNDQLDYVKALASRKNAVPKPSIKPSPVLAIEATEPSAIDLEYTAIDLADDKTNGALNIHISGGRSAQTIEEATEVLLQGSPYQLHKTLGDETLLDLPLKPEVPVNRLEDLYFHSDQKIAHIYTDTNKKIIRLIAFKPHPLTTKRIELSPVPAPKDNNDHSETNHNEVTPGLKQSLGDIVSTLAMSNGLRLIRRLGDVRLLDRQVMLESQPKTLNDLYFIPGRPIKALVIENKTLRVL